MSLTYKLKIFLLLLLTFIGSQCACILLLPSFVVPLQIGISICISFVFSVIASVISTNAVSNLANKAKHILIDKGYKESVLITKNELQIIGELEDYTERVYVKGQTEIKKDTSSDINAYFDKTVLFEKAPCPIFIVDTDGRIKSANKEFCVLAGMMEEDLWEKESTSIFPSREDTNKLISAMRRQDYWQGETDLLSTKGEFIPVKINASKVMINDVTIVQCFVTDIRDLKRREYEIEKQTKQVKKFDSLLVNREVKMIELKKEILKLNRKIKLLSK